MLMATPDDGLLGPSGITVDPAPGVARTNQSCWEQLFRQRVGAALRLDESSVAKLSRARTSVAFRVSGEQECAMTLLLDRRPPEVRSGGEAAEVTVELPPETVAQFLDGELVLGTALLSGPAIWRGPVRKYLRVDPILRALLQRCAAGDAGAVSLNVPVGGAVDGAA